MIDTATLVSGRLTLDYPADHVVRLTLDDPERLNAIDPVLHDDISRAIALVDADPETRAAIVTGRGRAFSAGGALSDEEPMEAQDIFALRYDSVLALMHGLVAMRTPLVSAINGPAVGAGLALALMADISIAAEDARLNEGHLRNGLVAGDHAVLIWPLLCGLAKTKYHVLLGETMTGREAADCNLVSLAVPGDALEAKSIEVATRLAGMAPHAMRMTKHVLNYWLRDAMPAFELSATVELAMIGSAESREAFAARADRRDPDFAGKRRF